LDEEEKVDWTVVLAAAALVVALAMEVKVAEAGRREGKPREHESTAGRGVRTMTEDDGDDNDEEGSPRTR